jgi:hypothetical protein
MKRTLFFFFIIVFLAVNYTNAQNPLNKIPHTLYNDFETGELFGWEAYPYAQDIGFDALFSTHKTPTHNNSRYALARPVRANDIVEVYQGFTKRLDIWTIPETKVQVAVYFQSDRKPESLQLSLGTFDGQRYFHTLKNVKSNEWIELNIPIEEFQLNGKPLDAGEHIQVVTLEANYPQVYYLNTYTILMDDFKINGERQRQFVGIDPKSSHFEMFNTSILNKHFFYDEKINLRVKAEGNISLNKVKGTLIDSNGDVVKKDIPFKDQNGEWVNKSIYRLRKRDPRGQWKIQFAGQSEKGPNVYWEIKFLVPGNPVTEHPRLFFSEEELKERLANEKSPVAKDILTNALKDTDFMDVDIDAIEEGEDRTAENLVGGPYSKTSVGFNAYGTWNNPNRKLGRVIEKGSFKYAFTGERAAGEKAKKALLKLCSFEKWNAAWMLERKFWTYYPVGYTLLPVAYGYDMLYDILTKEERKFVREAIMEKGLKLFHRDMVEMNRMPSNLTNHIAVLVGGHGLAATAIYGDDPDNPYLEPYLSGIITKAKTFIDRTYYEDGSYGEPKSGYMNMASREIVLIMEAFERNFGIDWATTTDVENFYKYPLQATHPSGLMADFGDGHNHFNSFTQHHSEYFVYRRGNPFLYKYVKPYWEKGKGGYLGYLWYRDNISPASRETLPTSKVFEAQGMVMRSGWEDSSTIISIRIGPHSNHYHFDQGTFQVMTNGEELLTDPGVGTGGYYANLDFNIYNTQAIGHNVMLVDHDPESQVAAHFDNDIAALRDWPRMKYAFAGEIADAVVGDLATVYKGKLDKYTRTLLYTKSGPLFLFDQVKSKSPDGHVYDWLFHAPENSISYDNQRVTIDQPKARMTLDVLSPEIESSRIRNNKDDHESFITLSSKPNLREVNFFAVLYPEAKSEDEFDSPIVTKRIDESGWIGARVEKSGSIDLGFFRTAHNAGIVEGFETDAEHFTATFNGSELLQDLYFEGSTFSGHGFSAKAEAAVACAVALGSSNIELEVKSNQVTNIILDIDKKPSRILSDGSVVENWHYNAENNSLMIELTKGMNNLSVELDINKI